MKKKTCDSEYFPSFESTENGTEDDDFVPSNSTTKQRKSKKKNSSASKSIIPNPLKSLKNEKNKSNQVNDQPRMIQGDSKISSNDINQCMDFCPICQVPLKVLKISPLTHTASCNVSESALACPDGSSCLSSNLFHYRDYDHQRLAAFRASEDFFQPDVVFTPQKRKAKRTPQKKSSGKKRVSRSPLASNPKSQKREIEPCCSKSLTEETLEKKDRAAGEYGKRKLLFDPKETDKSQVHEQLPSGDLNVTAEQESLPDTIIDSELWCSDLFLAGSLQEMENASEPLSPVPSNNPVTVKMEPQSQNSSVVPSAKVAVLYQDDPSDGDQQNVIGCKVQCSQSCEESGIENQGVLQANCSFVFKTLGEMNRDETIARSPLSVTLMVNSSGWEAVEVKGTESTDVQKIKVCLCECAHSLCVECSVSNRDLINEVKFNPAASTQHEKFFATMTDLGLKSMDKFVQPIQCDKAVRKDLLLSSCNQIAVSTVGLACNFESRNEEPIEVATSNSVCINENSTYPAGSSHENPPTKKTVDAFSLLRKACSSEGKGSAKTPVPFESLDRNSRPSTPLPMIAKKTTESSWTLFASRTEGPSKNSKSVPAYKRIPGTQFVVDAFKYGIIYGVKAYFLSHFHSDHYIGLKKGFSGPIFCSQVTANLVHLQLKVDKECLHILKIGEPRVVCGVEIEIFDANHCPGAIMILFRLLDGQTFLHVGDFRAHPSMEAFDQLRFVNKLYLDTTYCDKSYDFPPQDEVVNKVVQTVKEHLSQFKSTLIVCGTYTIGKEKVFLGIAEAFNLKIWTTTEKRKVLRCLEDANLNKRLTTDALSAQVHVLAMKDITVNELSQYLMKHSPRYSHCIGFKPTGWTTSKSLKGSPSDFQTTTLGKVTVYGVPYSEHSSFSELRRFVRHIKPKDIQVTVNLNKSTEYKKLFEKWLTSNRNDDSQLKMKQFFNSACSKTSC